MPCIFLIHMTTIKSPLSLSHCNTKPCHVFSYFTCWPSNRPHHFLIAIFNHAMYFPKSHGNHQIAPSLSHCNTKPCHAFFPKSHYNHQIVSITISLQYLTIPCIFLIHMTIIKSPPLLTHWNTKPCHVFFQITWQPSNRPIPISLQY